MNRIKRLFAIITDPERWGWMNPVDIGRKEDPYVDRLELIKTPAGGIYLHHIHREDIEPDPHDHPYAWCWSYIPAGSYLELFWPDKHRPEHSYYRTLKRASTGGCYAAQPTRS
jgi:hypothetical protein